LRFSSGLPSRNTAQGGENANTQTKKKKKKKKKNTLAAGAKRTGQLGQLGVGVASGVSGQEARKVLMVQTDVQREYDKACVPG